MKHHGACYNCEVETPMYDMEKKESKINENK